MIDYVFQVNIWFQTMTEFLILVTGKDFKIEPTDSFEVQLYLDENDIPCFKSVSWKKLQGGLPFQQNSILPGDQLLCKSFEVNFFVRGQIHGSGVIWYGNG